MWQSPVSTRVALATLGVTFLSACAVLDVFEPAGAPDVRFVYDGQTDFSVGDRTALVIAVYVEGTPLEQPPLHIASLNSTIVDITASGDTLVALKPGRADLHIRLEHSIFTGDAPDTTLRLRVSGGQLLKP